MTSGRHDMPSGRGAGVGTRASRSAGTTGAVTHPTTSPGRATAAPARTDQRNETLDAPRVAVTPADISRTRVIIVAGMIGRIKLMVEQTPGVMRMRRGRSRGTSRGSRCAAWTAPGAPLRSCRTGDARRRAETRVEMRAETHAEIRTETCAENRGGLRGAARRTATRRARARSSILARGRRTTAAAARGRATARAARGRSLGPTPRPCSSARRGADPLHQRTRATAGTSMGSARAVAGM